MTKEEFRNIENMTFKEVYEFLGVKPTTIIAKNLDCTKCPLFNHGCYGEGGWYACKSILKRFIKTGECND